jgi:hypothetical protein
MIAAIDATEGTSASQPVTAYSARRPSAGPQQRDRADDGEGHHHPQVEQVDRPVERAANSSGIAVLLNVPATAPA